MFWFKLLLILFSLALMVYILLPCDEYKNADPDDLHSLLILYTDEHRRFVEHIRYLDKEIDKQRNLEEFFLYTVERRRFVEHIGYIDKEIDKIQRKLEEFSNENKE